MGFSVNEVFEYIPKSNGSEVSATFPFKEGALLFK